ncbi:3D domain-containing protein [Niallia sp. Krafla_26]|uniref:3D domain-containing protein n=1 Tax=Niallia sp. Krafla_26 TaxID=3064703 RepID=UPI003D16D658
MRSLKRIFAAGVTSIILLSTTVVANAETSQELKGQLQENEAQIIEMQEQKEALTNQVETVQANLQSIENEINKNNENINAIQKDIEETKQLIEEKKQQIVILQDKVLARKGIMEERLVSMQHTDQVNIFLEVILNAENIVDLLERASAATTILSADKELIVQQQNDLKQIELEKAAIDEKEQHLNEQYSVLAKEQAKLEQNLEKRQQELTALQNEYNQVSSEISDAQQEKAAIQAKITEAQEKLKKEQEAARARANQIVQEASVATVSKPTTQSTSNKSTQSTRSGKEFYVTATAYSHEESKHGITALGYNIRTNPNIKLIAVDPSVIPLGSRVWVEGYGEAIAGDTGGAIKGHKIDVVMPNGATARQWGVKTVKIVILN